MLLAGLLAIAHGSSAQDQLPQGGIHISMSAGYVTTGGNAYCLPVANAAVGRQMAKDGGFEWQLANNYSTVPVMVRIVQSQAIAVTGRVEVSTRQPYYPTEATGQHTLTVIHDFIAPPSVPVTMTLLPRVAPRSAPTRPVLLHVKVFLGSTKRPFEEQDLAATQLEPAHVYSLLLTDSEPTDSPLASTINPGNADKLELPSFMSGQGDSAEGVLSFNHYVLPVERSIFTTQPLAARDFVFVCVDAHRASKWPAQDQLALSQFALGGGRLCLYNTDGAMLSGLPHLSTRALGRGWLICSTGGLPDARNLMDKWLTGELEEIVLWLHGSVRGQRILRQLQQSQVDQRDPNELGLDLAQVYPQGSTSHSPGYIQPIWLYRETCCPGATEPWDFPEFTAAYRLSHPGTNRNFGNPLLQNANLLNALDRVAQYINISPLFALMQQHRPISGLTLPLISVALLTVLLSFTIWRTRNFGMATFAGLIALAALLIPWLTISGLQPARVAFTLTDNDSSAGAWVARTLDSQLASSSGSYELPAGDIVRQIRADELGDATILSGKDPAPEVIRGAATGPIVSVLSDTAVPPEKTSPRMWLTSRQHEICLHVDTEALPAGATAMLSTPAGVEIIPGGQADHQTCFLLTSHSVIPGLQRLDFWANYYSAIAESIARVGSPPRDAWPSPTGPLRTALVTPQVLGDKEALSQTAWVGLLQSVGGLRSFLGEQCVLVCEVGQPTVSRASFIRLTLPLEESYE